MPKKVFASLTELKNYNRCGLFVGAFSDVYENAQKQIINVIVLQLENTYPHNSVVDNALIPLLVWDTAITEKVNFTIGHNLVVDNALIRSWSRIQP